MSRPPDDSKKPVLLERTLDFLLDKPLSAVTFRSLATALDVSTFTVVYHFGTRADLVRDIIDAVASRQRGFETMPPASELTLDGYLDALQRSFELSLLPRNRALQRLEFEAQMLEALEPVEVGHPRTRSAHQELQDRQRDALVALGLGTDDAVIEGRLLVDTFYGIQVGLVVNGDDQRAREGFTRALQQHRARIVELGGGAAG